MFHVSSKFKVSRRNYIKILSKFELEISQNFQLKFILNLKKFLWRKLFILESFKTIFYFKIFGLGKTIF
jgi:hypothetical protein